MKYLQKSSMLVCLLLSLSTVSGQYVGENKLYYGVSYYPESWPESQVAEDIRLMKEANINVVRMAEFSWSLMEPTEGNFDFEWLHKVIDQLHANDIAVILGTPTATPPAWLWEKYPEIGRVDEDGKQAYHGARKDYSYASEVYLKKSVRIVEAMAEEFGDKPGVIAWQIDNEFGLHFEYNPETKQKWHAWLKAKYGTIANLNQKWATELWSQTYQRFDQIPMPRSWIWHHNSLRMEWSRFNSDLIVDYMNQQIAIIRKYSKLPITHDTMPGQKLDYEDLMSQADFMTVNNYHSFEAYDRVYSNYDRMRGYQKDSPHWLFETAPNNSGGGTKGQTWFLHQPDGSLHSALWMNYALGGQGALFWLWRQHRAGQEMVHGSFIHAWGEKVANFEDLKKLGADLKKSSDFLMSNPIEKAKVAILYSHEAEMGLRIEQYANDIRYYHDWTYRFFHALSNTYLHRDVIGFQTLDLSSYKLIFLPLAPYIPDAFRAKLKTWVQEGGHLVFGPMSGYRTEEWAFFTDHAYGDINDWSRIRVTSRIPIGTERREKEIPLLLDWENDLYESNQEAFLWADALTSEKGEVLATYQNGMHNGRNAVITNEVGKGKITMLGTDPGKANLSTFLKNYAKSLAIEPTLQGESGLVVGRRVDKKENTTGYVLDNITSESKTVTLEEGTYTDLLSGKDYSESVTLAPYEVLVLEKK